MSPSPELPFRLVATDLDGTLLDSQGAVTVRTRSTLSAVEALGVAVVFVTGRPTRWMETLWTHVGDHGLAVCSNGGLVYDVRARAVRSIRPIPVEVALEVATVLREQIPGTAFAVERASGFGREPGFLTRSPVVPGLQVADLPDLLDDGTVKLLARHEELDPEIFWRRTEGLVGHLVTTTWSSTGALVEMSAAGVTKATTLARLCENLGMGPLDVVAFGDMPNDLPMLRWAGTSYAMANAHPDVVRGADRRAPGNDQDGVAVVLEQVFGVAGAGPSGGSAPGAPPSENRLSEQDSAANGPP